jgi:hypothetical protein
MTDKIALGWTKEACKGHREAALSYFIPFRPTPLPAPEKVSSRVNDFAFPVRLNWFSNSDFLGSIRALVVNHRRLKVRANLGVSYQSAKVRGPCHQNENNQGKRQHDDGEPICNPAAPEENESAKRCGSDNQHARKCHLRRFLMLLDGGFPNAWQILHKLFGWFARQVGWNSQQSDDDEEAQAGFFNSSLFLSRAQPSSARPKAVPSTGM